MRDESATSRRPELKRALLFAREHTNHRKPLNAHTNAHARAAEQAEDPKRRALLLKLADDWRRDADKLRQQATDGCAQARPASERRGAGCPE
jgi:hypothetical protein